MLETLFQNRGPYCAAYSLKSILHHLGLNTKIKEVISYLGQEGDHKIVYPVQIASALMNFGVEFEYFAHSRAMGIRSEEEILSNLRNLYSPFAEKIIETTNIASVLKAIQKVSEAKRATDSQISLQLLEQKLALGEILLCLINYDLFVGRENKFSGHYIIVIGQENGEFVYHDTGPKSYAKFAHVPNERLMNSMSNFCWMDRGLIAISPITLSNK